VVSGAIGDISLHKVYNDGMAGKGEGNIVLSHRHWSGLN